MDEIILSPSRVNKWIRCKRLYYWRYCMHLQKVSKEFPLNLGLIVSETLAGYYRGQNGARSQTVLNECLSKALSNQSPSNEKLSENGELKGLWEKVNKVSHLILDHYHENLSPRDNFKVLEVETSRKIKLTPKVSLLAIPDAVVSLEDTRMILEHKVRHRYSTGDFGLDLQSVCCCLVTESIGTCYNVLQYSHVKYFREIIIRSQNELDYFRNMLIAIGEEILTTPPEKLYPQPMKRCSCEYWELCNAEQKGTDIEDIINELYFMPVVLPRKEKEHSQNEVTEGKSK